ncbi:MAG: hypothetical protein BWZ07_03241 [Alphaproteobacteria bacterium ADurb.BinA280]|nr:MAG: hypothetical protein BWZ07_03241 [Alphaproteobacteria bacterium ADurb.BinA280]
MKVHGPDHVRHVVGQKAVALFRQPQGLAGFLAGGQGCLELAIVPIDVQRHDHGQRQQGQQGIHPSPVDVLMHTDGDMLVRDDIVKLWSLRDESKAVMVVKHDYKTKANNKYLGSKNQDYPRKNWSSVVLWNCGHPDNRVMTPEFIENATGAQLHRFTWLADEQIGELPKVWNWLPDELGENPDAKLLHWTLGTPSFHEYADAPMAGEWHRERILMDYCLQRDID